MPVVLSGVDSRQEKRLIRCSGQPFFVSVQRSVGSEIKQKERTWFGQGLLAFVSEKNLHGHSAEIPDTSDLVFYKAFVRLFDILWQVAEEYKCWIFNW